MDLFSYDFEKARTITKEEIEQAAKDLAQFLKENGNPRVLSVSGLHCRPNECGQVNEKKYLPNSIEKMIPFLKDEGYIKFERDGVFFLKHEYRDYHTIDELVERFRQIADDYFENGGDLYGLYSISTTFGLHYNVDLSNHEINMGLGTAIRNEITSYSKNLGLKHFIEVPKSRGMKMNCFIDGELKAIKRIMAEELVEYTDYQSVKDYFKRHGAVSGPKYQKSYDPHGISSNQKKIEMHIALPSAFCCQSIAESKDIKEIMMIMDYMGKTYGPFGNEELILINEKNVRKRYKRDRDNEKTFEELYDLDAIISEENSVEAESLFSMFDETILDNLFVQELEGVGCS
ncbi:hypothetical protein AWH56_008935 [Anaerobacillus isosaccharinicus]|uniref:Uncharacterized protein n=1 Tax=Anaerobacillus isosaccharinicus TaxID=1532552 RepID=A0A1S2KY47_9BACI|nr:hypothetical protein [Anaerobacillus isosaccharinicus]QOY37686.1 hypothetical protein AWH56_008935 [Anaerobacillus isosaccharinicus]